MISPVFCRTIPLRTLASLGSFRSISQLISATLTHAPHRFNIDEAHSRFIKADQNRRFKPITFKNSTGKEIIRFTNPINKVSIPFFGVTAKIVNVSYEGEYGIVQREKIKDGEEGDEVEGDNHEVCWHPIKGTIKGCSYDFDDQGMRIYGGFSWDSGLIEKAFNQVPCRSKLVPLDDEQIDESIFLDSFHKRAAYAQEIAYERLRKLQMDRAKNDINNRVTCDLSRVSSVEITYEEVSLHPFYLPGYILENLNAPPRIMSAVDEEVHIAGQSKISMTKSMSVAAAVMGVTALFLPPVFTIPLKFALVATTSTLTGFWAKYRLSIINARQKQRILSEKEKNASTVETDEDLRRREKTIQKLKRPSHSLLPEGPCKVLGLDPNLKITVAMVYNAFVEKAKGDHPDSPTGSAEKMRDLLNARQLLLKALKDKQN